MTSLILTHRSDQGSSRPTSHRRSRSLLIAGLPALVALALLLGGCGRATPDVEATAQALAQLWAAQTAAAQPAATEAVPPATLAPSATPEPPAPAGTSLPPATDTSVPPAPTAAPSSTPTSTLTPTPTRTFTPTPTYTPTPTPTPPCPIAVDPELAPAWDRASLGCPMATATVVWAAWEPFEHGTMWWRSDKDWTYVLNWQDSENPSAGMWVSAGDAWKWDGSFPDGHGLTPPAGLFEPVRGFGFVWFSYLGGPTSAIGWASDKEKGFCANLQLFQTGLIFHSNSTVEFCNEAKEFNSARDANFSPLLISLAGDGAWKRY